VRPDRLAATAVPKGLPSGAVGVIASEMSEAPSLVREILDHREHYRKTSDEFARACRTAHEGTEVVGRVAGG
jgi:hypothetical protein